MRSVGFALVLSLVTSGGAAPSASGQEGGGAVPPRPGAPGHKSPKRGPGYVTYVGFQRMDDSARVFLRVSSEAQPQQSVAGDELVVRLPGFRLDMANNGRPLDTRYFGTPVLRVRAEEVKGAAAEVDVHVSFAKGGAREAKVSTGPADDGDAGTYVYLDF